jgi:hypothetical protein
MLPSDVGMLHAAYFAAKEDGGDFLISIEVGFVIASVVAVLTIALIVWAVWYLTRRPPEKPKRRDKTDDDPPIVDLTV